jgi:YD repeat-containing protein
MYYTYDAVGNYLGSNIVLYAKPYTIESYKLGPQDKITVGSPGKKEYTYAPNQNKISEQNPAGSSVYHYNEAGNLISETEADGAFKRDYVYLGGTLLARVEADGKDLAVYREDIGFTPSNMNPVSKPVTIRASIHNYGSSLNTANVKVNFYEVMPSTGAAKPLTLIGSRTITGSGTAELIWIPTKKGVHEIYAWVDPPVSVITEIDKTNNIASNFLFTDPSYIRINPKDQEAFKIFMRRCQRGEVACEK